MMTEHPVDNAAPSFRAAWLTGKFQGVKAATGPTGSFSTRFSTPSLLAGITRPYVRRLSSANQSSISADAKISALDSAIGFPCSRVIIAAIALTLRRSKEAASRKTAERSTADVFCHVRKPFAAAAKARSRSVVFAQATSPITSSVAGSRTGIVLPETLSRQTPSMKN